MRTFIAVTLPAATKAELAMAVSRLRTADLQASWVKPDNLHITMKFLGEVQETAIPAIKQAMTAACAGETPFNVRLEGFGFFPPRGRPRVLFAATDQQLRLRQLAEKLEHQLAGIGFPYEGRFKSHITLARCKGSKNLKRLQELLAAVELTGSFPVSGLCLYRSILTASGARYELICRTRFAH